MEVGRPFLIKHIVLSVPSEQKTNYLRQPVDKTTGEYSAFTSALRKILQVSHAEMLERLAQEKKAKASKPQPSVSRDSRAKD